MDPRVMSSSTILNGSVRDSTDTSTESTFDDAESGIGSSTVMTPESPSIDVETIEDDNQKQTESVAEIHRAQPLAPQPTGSSTSLPLSSPPSLVRYPSTNEAHVGALERQLNQEMFLHGASAASGVGSLVPLPATVMELPKCTNNASFFAEPFAFDRQRHASADLGVMHMAMLHQRASHLPANNSGAMNGNNKRYLCQRCLNHGQTFQRKGHKPFCSYADCRCADCILVDRRRELNNEINRAITPEQNADDANVHTPNGGRVRAPKCARCLVHGKAVPLRGHKKTCPHAGCRCRKCLLVGDRRSLMARQIKLRRVQKNDLQQRHSLHQHLRRGEHPLHPNFLLGPARPCLDPPDLLTLQQNELRNAFANTAIHTVGSTASSLFAGLAEAPSIVPTAISVTQSLSSTTLSRQSESTIQSNLMNEVPLQLPVKPSEAIRSTSFSGGTEAAMASNVSSTNSAPTSPLYPPNMKSGFVAPLPTSPTSPGACCLDCLRRQASAAQLLLQLAPAVCHQHQHERHHHHNHLALQHALLGHHHNHVIGQFGLPPRPSPADPALAARLLGIPPQSSFAGVCQPPPLFPPYGRP